MFVCWFWPDVHLSDPGPEARRVLLWSSSELPLQELRLPERVRLRNGEVVVSASVTGNSTDPGSAVETASTAGEALAVGARPSVGARGRMRVERAGIVCSSLCALHCVLPLVVTATALVSSVQQHGGEHAHHGQHAAHGGGLQLALMGTSVVVSGLVLGRSYLREHRDVRPLAAFGLALVLLALGWAARPPDALLAMMATAVGLLALVGAQVVNVVLRRRGRSCAPRSDASGCCGSG